MHISIKAPFLPKHTIGFGGVWPFVIVHKDWWDKQYVHEHEKVHNKQCLEGWFVLFWWKYLTDRKARYQYELEAYRVSVQYGRDLHEVASILHYNHGFAAGKTYKQVVGDLDES